MFLRRGKYMEWGANLVYKYKYSWKLQYLDFKGGIGYMAQFKYIKPYLTVMGYYAPLLRGNSDS